MLGDARLPWAVVIDASGRLRGWVGEKDLFGEGSVSDRMHRMEAWVPADASLKQAFAEMLQHDAGWVAVLDRDNYLGRADPRPAPRRPAPFGRPVRRDRVVRLAVAGLTAPPARPIEQAPAGGAQASRRCRTSMAAAMTRAAKMHMSAKPAHALSV